ncbi:MAG: hypothetical protein DMF17_02000 [Verrucomicrobia bacterium]|nr:MAG: hypothetical protein DMF17_02000 [Verrucomicrobiota bacterium]
MDEIYEDKAAAERALNARRIIEFPRGDSGERHVIQDERGFWRIVPGPAPTSRCSCRQGDVRRTRGLFRRLARVSPYRNLPREIR